MTGDPFIGLPRRHFRAILADPPWRFKPYAPPQADAAGRRDVERHYECMDLGAIKALPVKSLAHPDGCHLFLWVTSPCLPMGLETMTAWGFKYSSLGLPWAKLNRSADPCGPLLQSDFFVGLGLTTRGNWEGAILGRYRNPKRRSKKVRQLIIAPRRAHSQKPDEQYSRIEEYCDGPYLELFARQSRPGWVSWGHEAGKLDGAAA